MPCAAARWPVSEASRSCSARMRDRADLGQHRRHQRAARRLLAGIGPVRGGLQQRRRHDEQVVGLDAAVLPLVVGHAVHRRHDAVLDGLGQGSRDVDAPGRLIGIEGLGGRDVEDDAVLGQRVDVDADQRVGARQVGQVQARLELVAGANGALRVEAGLAVAVHVPPWRAVAAEVRVVVAGQRHVTVARHDHRHALRLEHLLQPLGDGQRHRLLGVAHAALPRIRHAPVEAAAVAGVDRHHQRAGVGRVDGAVGARRRDDLADGALAGIGGWTGRQRGAGGRRRGRGRSAAGNQDGRQQPGQQQPAAVTRPCVRAGHGTRGRISARRLRRSC